MCGKDFDDFIEKNATSERISPHCAMCMISDKNSHYTISVWLYCTCSRASLILISFDQSHLWYVLTIHTRVDMVETNHTKVLSQWRHMANGSISRQYFFDVNYFHLLLGVRSFQKSAFLKLTILIFQYFWHQNWDQWKKLSGKKTHIFFFYFGFKNKRVWAEKIGKKRKNSKTLKVASNYPNI